MLCFNGVKINYDKLTLIPMNCHDDWVEEVSSLLKCGISKLVVTYLDISLVASLRKTQTWKLIIEKVEKRLALCEARNLSTAGRLVLT